MLHVVDVVDALHVVDVVDVLHVVDVVDVLHVMDVVDVLHVVDVVDVRQTKMAVVDSNIQHRHVALTNHCTLAARCPNAKLVHKNSMCFME